MIRILTICIVILASSVPALSRAQSDDKWKQDQEITSTPAVITADDMSYDNEKSLVIASGNVEVVQGKRILLADQITYDKPSNKVIATGNVSLKDPNGTVVFAQEVELFDDLKQGIITDFSVRFPDNSVMAGKSGRRVNENKLAMRKVVYSPCPVCKEKPDKDPLWQVKAGKATINNAEQRVYYNNARFEVYGMPVLYTPYISHATPDADRKSGFLVPKYSNDKIFGTTIKAPYYYDIAPNKDATITPIFTSKEGEVLAGEYRHMLKSGSYQLRGSITNPDEVDVNGNKTDGKDIRGHLQGDGKFTINEEWDWGFYGKRASDDTYLRKYNFGDEDVLTSSLYTTRIKDRDHALINTVTFQGLKTNDDPGTTPLILPYAEMHTERKLGSSNAKALLDANTLVLTRDEGISSKRLSVKGTVLKPYVSSSGHVFEAGLSLRGDGYFVDDVPDTNVASETIDGATGRVIPQADLKWSLPMIKTTAKRDYFLEPVTTLIISPNGGNPDKIPNEDSQDIEFSDENLFDANHFTGYDRVETGNRVNYGLRGGASDSQYGNVNFLLGQNYRTKEDNAFRESTGLDDNLSDFVGKIDYNKNNIFDVAYKFRFDKDDFSLRRNSVAAGINYKPVRFNIDYIAMEDNLASDDIIEPTREIAIASTTIDLNEQWELTGRGHRNLENGGWISTGAGLLYKGKCVDFSTEWLREFTRDRDIRPNSTISFQVTLRNMGYHR